MSEGFANPIIGGGGGLEYPSIHSPNYVTTVSGWTINRDGTAEFNSVTIRNGQIISGTSLYYSGPPAAGNLIASIATAGGTDSFGNIYQAGVAAYNPTSFAQLSGAQLLLGITGAAGSPGIIQNDGEGELLLESGLFSGADIQAYIALRSKLNNSAGSASVAIGTNPAGGIAGTGQAVLDVFNTIFLNNRSGTPAAPTGGYILFANAGALKGIGSSGTVTALGPA